MKYVFIILFVVSALYSCQFENTATANNQKLNNTVTKTVENIKPLKSVKSYRFNIDNNNLNSFGFLLIEEDQSIGVRSIVLHGDYLYISDPFHGNIKKMRISDGELSSSLKLDSNYKIREITVFNNFLYVFTDDTKCYSLDLDLNIKAELTIPKYRWVKDIFKQTQKELMIYRPIEDVIQLADKSTRLKIVKIGQDNSISKDSLTLTYEQFESSAYSPKANHIRGIKYDYVANGNKTTLTNQYGVFELKEKLSNTAKFYDSKNIDFTESKIAHFSVTNNEVIIAIYEF
jgi:hypothetical protein